MGWGAGAMTNPPPFSSGLGTGHGGVSLDKAVLIQRNFYTIKCSDVSIS